ncbi:SAM-dependent methyltransferase [Nocardia sp. PE-7]|uniref:SAM-dependent methyltransferase n=1 Tax=Nocardia sp. PE-7 TaxID=3058426 RepID=UPI00265B1CC3|nr:SAM-dependent methyltransferase [Nocardia sp. PE-7]WKG08220.1 SAM-dependent methyltransferase [Nocardia sp. PE-7]
MTTRPRNLIDPYQPTPARLHSVFLGGKDHYEPDDSLAKNLSSSTIRPAITESRRFTRRAVEYLSDHHRVSQFVELGSGLPHAPNIHDIAEQRSDTARTLYVDSDILVAAHGRAMLHEGPRYFTDTDIVDTDAIMGDIAAVMDIAAPLAVCVSGTAEWISDAPAVLAALTARFPVGTWLVLTHVTDEFYPDHIQAAAETLRRAGIPYHPRGRGEITAMLAGYQLLAPGLIAPHRWPPTPSRDDDSDSENGDGDGDGIRRLSATAPRHRAAWDLSAYAAIGQRQP